MNKSSPIYIFAFIILVSLVFGIAVSSVHYATLDMLKKNETMHRNRALAQAFNLSVSEDNPRDYQLAIAQAIESDTVIYDNQLYPIFFKQKGPKQVGFIFSGMGFWDRITGILVLTPDLQKIVNIRLLEQKETPGLGARIEESWFTDQFKGLPIAWEQPPEERIIINGGATGRTAQQVDAITGATQTSMALMKILNTELTQFRQIYKKHHLNSNQRSIDGR